MKGLLKTLVLVSLTALILLTMASCDALKQLPFFTDTDANEQTTSTPEENTTPAETPEQTTPQEHKHVIVIDDAIAPTCTETGLTEGQHCSECGKVLVAQEIVDALGHKYETAVTAPTCTTSGYTTYTCFCGDTYVADEVAALGHTEVADKAVEPTCTETGLTEGSHCSVCGETVVAQEIVPANGHDYKAEVTEPTCLEGGYTTYTCFCGDSYVADEVAALGHTEVADKAVEPTCTETGLTEGLHCSVCGETLVAQEIIPANGHDYDAVVTDPTCTAEGYTTYTCHCGDTYVADKVNALGHTEVVDAAVEPTCTETGLTEGKHCSVCGDVLVAQEVVDALGHDYDAVVTAPTCTEEGYTTYTCQCGDTYVADEVAPLGHKYDAAVTAPTCTEKGYTTYTCFCGDTYVADEVAALGHTEVVDAAVEPTCTETGLTEGLHCSVCGEVLVAQEVVDALGHDYDAFVTAPTCTEEGYTTYTCHCGDSYVADKVDALGHNYDAVVTDPTCTAEGYTTYTCQCGDTYVADKVDALGHTEVVDAAVEPTCTETGLTEGSHCSVCNEVLVHQTVVEELGHTVVVDKAVAPDCINTGLTEGKHCSVCGEVLVAQEIVNALGHTEEIVEGKDATCTETGLTEGSKCSVCGETLVAQETINALGHTEEVVEGKDAACTETGLTEGSKCSVCGETLVAQEIIPALGHTTSDWITDKEATYEEDGQKHLECTVCGEILETSKIPQLHHNYVSVVTEPTCEAVGYTTHTCTDCGDSYTDTIVPATGHSYGDWKTLMAPTCTVAGVEESICSACEKRQNRPIPAPGHTEETIVGTPATCTDSGLTDGKKCTTCGKITVEQTVIEALGHKYEAVVTAPTCTTEGYTTYTCFCGDSYVADEVDALGHDEVILPAVAPTCTKTGKTEGKYCSVCEETLVAQTVVAALGHTAVVDEAKAPTCTETGLSEGKHCSVCDAIIVAQNEVAALGHKYEAVVTAPTCTTEGYTTYTCFCGDTYVDNKVNALGHTVVVDEAKAPTCTATGLTEGSHCSVCGEILVAQNVVDALGHTEETLPAVAPTCTATGLTEGTKCSTCGEILVAQTTVSALGHKYEATVTAPTCTEKGYTTYTCFCGSSYVANEVAAKGHKYEATVTAPTCTEKGYTTYTCFCGDTYVADEVDALGHDYETEVTAPTCTEEGYTTYTCFCGDTYVGDKVDALGHTAVVDEAKAPTCTETGLTEGSHCSVCDETIVAQEVVPVIAHTYTDYVCTVCGQDDPEHYFEMTIEEALAQKDGKNVSITGTVTVIDTEWSEQYKNISVIITDENGKSILVFRLSTNVGIGDVITVNGTMTTYGDIREIAQGGIAVEIIPHVCSDFTELTCTEASKCTVCGKVNEEAPGHNYKYGVCENCGEQYQLDETTVEISFADKANRTEYSTSIQVWEQNGIIVTNNKAGSTTNVGDYAKPARFYKGSEIIIAYTGMTKIVIDATGMDSKYVTPWVTDLNKVEGVTATNASGIITVVFDTPVDSITITTSAQVRANKITVTASKACEHNEVVVDAVDATCTETGLTEGSRCLICGEWFVEQEETPALGHNYGDWTVVKEATEQEDGLQQRTCSACGHVDEELIPKLSHVHNHIATVTAPTCTEKGYTTYTCACGDTYTADEVDALGHTYESVVTAPTCTSVGFTTYTCACGDTYTADEVPTLTHGDSDNNYKCDACNAVIAPAADSVLTIEQANALGKVHEHNTYTTGKYYVTGVITEVYNTTYGNMKIKDEAGNILTIYGTYSADGSTRYDALEVKPVAGDTVTIYGIVGQYQGTAQIKNGAITAHTAAETPEEPEVCEHADANGDYKCDACSEIMAPAADSVLTIEQVIALGKVHAHNTYTTGKYSVTGVITEVYNTTYGNMYITDGNGNTLTIYGTYDAEGNLGYSSMTTKPVAGDTVTIYGIVGQYNGTAQIKNGWITVHTPATPEGGETTCEHTNLVDTEKVDATCTTAGSITKVCADCEVYTVTETIDALGHTTDNGTCERCGEVIGGETPDAPVVTEKTETLTITATTGSLASDSLTISWASGDVIFTNAKNTASSAIRTSDSDHFRVYAGNKVTISCSNITKVVITCTSGSYATVCAGSLATTGATATVNGSIVTITVTSGTLDSIEIGATAQWRLNKVEVTYNEVSGTCEHDYVETTKEATCTEAGSISNICSKCGDTEVIETLPATGHSYGEWVETTAPTCTEKGEQSKTCSSCGDVQKETILATGHNFVDGTCTGCGESENDAPAVEPIGEKKYTFSNYAAGTQYAKGEVHELDEYVTVTTTESHFTSELRLYSSSTHNGYAIFETAAAVKGISFNAGNKVDTLNVYGSTDGETWVLIEGVSITTTSYKDYTVNVPADSAYTFIKLDVAGTQQVRIKSITFNLA